MSTIGPAAKIGTWFLVVTCKDGQQFILFKRIHCHNTPLLFDKDPGIEPNKMCDGVLWTYGNPERWVRWWCKYLIDIAAADHDEDTI